MAQPNSTTDSIATFTYADGTPVTASAITVVVTFPDRTTQTYSMLGGDVVSAGSGKYKLTYTTKDAGMHREVWNVSDSASSVGEFRNDTEAKY